MSYSTRTKPARIAIALVLTLALIFGLAPLLPSGTASADDPAALTVEFRSGATVDGTITYTMAELTALALAAPANTDKYLAWDGTKFVVLATSSSIPISTLLTNKAATPAVSNTTIANGDIVEVTDGTVTKTFGGRSVGANSFFYGDTTETTGIGSNTATATTVLSAAVLSLDTGKADVAGTADATSVSTFGDTPLRFLTGLDNRDAVRSPRTWDQYLKEEDAIARYVSGVTKISVVRSGPLANFKVFTQIGDNGQKKLAKNFTLDELNKLANNDVRAYLQSNPTSGINWAVHATNKYVTVDKLLADAGVAFNAGDILVPRADDGFQTKLDYEFIQANRFFYGGTTATSHDTNDPIDVGAVLAINWYLGTNITAGTAKTTLGTMDWTGTSVRNTGRFYAGVSRANYLNSDAAGSRLVQAPTEFTIIKDALDTLTDSNVILAKTEYIATGEQIKPEFTVTYGAMTLRKDTDYEFVSYGANKDVGNGTVTIKGIGNFTGTATKTFTIKAEPKITIAKIADQTYSGKAKTPKLTVKADGKAIALGTGYTAKYSNNKNIGKATVAVTIKDGKTYTATFKINPKKTAGFKLKALKKSFKASWKKDSQATGYEIQYGTDSKISKGIKKYTAKKTAVTRTFKSLKSKKTYYAKIRTYKTVSGVKYYSAWSKTTKIKTK